MTNMKRHRNIKTQSETDSYKEGKTKKVKPEGEYEKDGFQVCISVFYGTIEN